MFSFSVQQIVPATDNSGSSLNSNRTLSTIQNTSFDSLLKELEKLRTENAKIRKENADLKTQVVSNSVNHTIFSLSISLCSRMLSTIVLL